MKNTSILLSSLLISLFIISCNDTQKTTKDQHETQKKEVKVVHEEHVLALNNGQKWIVNEEMKPYIIKGEKLITTFIKEKEDSFSKLAKNIEEQNQLLIKSCTMKGESHNELHKWLAPHLALINQLKKQTSPNEGHRLVEKLKASYETYHQFFH